MFGGYLIQILQLNILETRWFFWRLKGFIKDLEKIWHHIPKYFYPEEPSSPSQDHSHIVLKLRKKVYLDLISLQCSCKETCSIWQMKKKAEGGGEIWEKREWQLKILQMLQTKNFTKKKPTKKTLPCNELSISWECAEA